MTILFFARLFYPHIGGVEKHVLEIGKRLVKKGHRVIVFTQYQSGAPGAKMAGEIDGIKIHRINAGEENFFKKFRVWRELWKLKSIIRSADIVHCHDIFFWYLPFRFLYPSKPVYTTFHGYETKFPPSKKAIIIRKISEKLSRGNICVGEYIAKWYGTKPTYTTYGGVGILPINTNTTNKYQSKNKKLKILFVGRLDEDTGISVYLEALNLVNSKKLKVEFEACGNGSLRISVERYGKVYGFVKDMSQYIQRADIVFASSYLSILEVMMYKKLIFAVYDNSLKEDYLKMSPFAKWIVIENSPKSLTDKVLYFSKHIDKKRDIAGKAYEWAKLQTWDNVVKIYLKLWRI